MSPKDDLTDLSLDDIEEGLKKPGPPRGPSGGAKPAAAKKSRRGSFFLVGLLLGIAGTIFLPPLVGPYLPASLRPSAVQVSGPVLAKRLESADRLLLTVRSDQGALLAIFTERVSEIDLLVGEGDTVTLGLARYRPFVENPAFEGIRKATSPAVEQPSRTEPLQAEPAGEAGEATGQPAASQDTTQAGPST